MAIPPRVIGGSQEAQLLWNISNQLETQKGILSPASTNTILTNGSQLTQIVDSWGN